MNKRKLKKGVILKLVLILLTFILLLSLINVFSHLRSNDRKFKNIGYSTEEIEHISNIDDNFISLVIDNEYNEHIPYLLNEKYFIEENFEKYIEHKENNTSLDYNDVISIVNTHNHLDHYEEVHDTDTSKEKLMLVNRYYKLNSDYSVPELNQISLQYSYNNNSLNLEALNSYVSLWRSAKGSGYNLIANGSYRSYSSQESIYERNREIQGTRRTDEIIARPGHSEHQTGLALDINILGVSTSDYDKTEEFEWLSNNAHKFGFIMRYPKDKEHITGFNYEPWHYRYVGVEVAKYIFENNITFDEYYAFYLK